MKELSAWTLDTIRNQDSSFSWMEEYRFEWLPLVQNACYQSVVNGKCTIVITDDDSIWFEKYILHHINDMKKERPLLPFYSLREGFPNLNSIKTTDDIQLLEDMFELSYPNGYYFWYIGQGVSPLAKIAYRNQDSFLWITDDIIQDSFPLKGSDSLHDIKLLQLFNLFDETISAALFGDIDIDI